MTSKRLPIGIQNFREIREGGFYYVDKTSFALRLIDEGKYYFLSRPRRFGKSLFLDTLGELFSGNKPLFRDLAIHDRWDWSRRFPVIRLSLGAGVLQDQDALDRRLGALLRHNARALGLPCAEPEDPAGFFAELIEQAPCHQRRARRGAGGRIRQTHPR